MVDRTATFANIATRLRVETGDNVLIGGFIVTGMRFEANPRPRARTVGPVCRRHWPIPPRTLHGAGQLVATNDNWQDAPNEQEIIDSSIAPSQAAEPAILRAWRPATTPRWCGARTASTGVGSVEVYDLEAGSDSRLANISTRGLVQTGDNVLIGGFDFHRHKSATRDRARDRSVVPVAGALADPNLELRDGNGALLAANDNWRSNQEAEIIATMVPPTNDAGSGHRAHAAARPAHRDRARRGRIRPASPWWKPTRWISQRGPAPCARATPLVFAHA